MDLLLSSFSNPFRSASLIKLISKASESLICFSLGGAWQSPWINVSTQLKDQPTIRRLRAHFCSQRSWKLLVASTQLRGEEKEGLQLGLQNRSYCHSLGLGTDFTEIIQMPGHIAEKQSSIAGSKHGLSSVHLEHVLSCSKFNKEHFASWEGLWSSSTRVATHRNHVGW